MMRTEDERLLAEMFRLRAVAKAARALDPGFLGAGLGWLQSETNDRDEAVNDELDKLDQLVEALRLLDEEQQS